MEHPKIFEYLWKYIIYYVFLCCVVLTVIHQTWLFHFKFGTISRMLECCLEYIHICECVCACVHACMCVFWGTWICKGFWSGNGRDISCRSFHTLWQSHFLSLVEKIPVVRSFLLCSLWGNGFSLCVCLLSSWWVLEQNSARVLVKQLLNTLFCAVFGWVLIFSLVCRAVLGSAYWSSSVSVCKCCLLPCLLTFLMVCPW